MITNFALSIILAAIVLAFYVIDFYFMLRYDQQRQQAGKGWSWDYTLITIIVGIFVLLQPIVIPQVAWSTAAPWGLWIQIIGGISVVSSFVLHIWSRFHLQHFYTERVEVQSNHRVIDTGPYALVRHPLIVSFFLIAIGVFLLNPAITTGLVLVYIVLSFNNSARQEEKLLTSSVPGYDKYMDRVPRFLPRLRKNQ